MDLTPPLDTLESPSVKTKWSMFRLVRKHRLFLFTVVIPTILATIYYGLIASDIYVSESRFIVRSPQRQATGGLIGTLLQGTGFSHSQDDTYSVHDFILSRDALKQLENQVRIKKTFSNRKIDFLNRFPGLGMDDSFEGLYQYYQKRVGIDYDTASSISVLRVSAFNAEDAYRINSDLLSMSEHLINDLNDRARKDLIQYATAEVTETENKDKQAALAISSYRNQQSVFEPDKQAALQLQQVSKLQDELISTKTQLAQIDALSPDNPQIPTLRQRVATLQAEMAAETAKVVGAHTSLSNKDAGYQRLALDKAFADRQLASALASLETAKEEAQRQQLYLERLVQPNKPDTAVEPRRLRSVLSVFALGMILWGVLTILIAGVREHRD